MMVTTSSEHKVKKLSLVDALRPKSLDEVIGHDDIKPVIRNLIAKECQRWLFYGSTGTGKTSLAHIVARELQGPTYPVGLIEIHGADRSAPEMRDLIEKTDTVCTLHGTYRIIIIDEAQQLTEQVKTLLLKPLEQEQSCNVWILCTMDVTKLDRALRDRCARFHLEGMGPNERRQLVERAAERLGYTGDTAKFLNVINDRGRVSAREILGDFEMFANGMPIEAVGV
jgi:replication-associated recombination protein RarA